MKFRSTRGGVEGASFEDVLTTGYAPDGGLYVPEQMPSLDLGQLHHFSKLDYPSLAEAILSMFVGDELPAAELTSLLHSCYADFDCEEVVPVRKVGNIFVAELFHGPTFCFKDLGQQPLVRLLARFAEKRSRRHTMLVATTGDTGPAAMRAVSDSGSPNIDMVVFFPEGQISELQRRQMTTCSSARAQVVTFQGGGDDMDAPLKNMSTDREFAATHGLCGINSFNFVRPLCQTVHYFWTYFRTLEQTGLKIGAPIDVVVPSGALGNLTAGFMSKKMGLPIAKFVAGTNANDITHRTFTKGEFHRQDSMEKTLSDAINIQVPYNMERIFYYLTNEDSSLVSAWMAEMERSGCFTLPKPWLAKLQETFSSRRVDDEWMCATMRRGVKEHSYISDPHTSVALAAAWDVYGDQAPARPVAVLATASPCKFESVVTEALGPALWAVYASGDSFPAEARSIMEMPENSFRTFEAKGDLMLTQTAWEQTVRDMLNNRSTAAARAKL